MTLDILQCFPFCSVLDIDGYDSFANFQACCQARKQYNTGQRVGISLLPEAERVNKFPVKCNHFSPLAQVVILHLQDMIGAVQFHRNIQNKTFWVICSAITFRHRD